MNKNKFYLITAILLLVSLCEMPYGYYTMLRIVVSTMSGLIIYENRLSNNKALLVAISGIILIIFNPIIPVYLTREIWAYIDVVTAIIFAGYYLKNLQKKEHH